MPMGDSVARSMNLISKLLLFSITALGVWGCTPKESTGGFSQNQNEPAAALLEQFLDEYYRERVGNLTVLEIDERATLEDLHLAIQKAVSFDNDHLYDFYASRPYRNRQIRYS